MNRIKILLMLIALINTLLAEKHVQSYVSINGSLDKKEIKKGIELSNKPKHVEASITYYADIDQHTQAAIGITNKYKNTMIKDAYINIEHRYHNSFSCLRIGTVNMYKGLFDKNENSATQSYSIIPNNAVYDAQWAAWMESTVGVKATYRQLYTTSYSDLYLAITKPFVKDKKEFKKTIFGYEPKFADIENNELIFTIGAKYNYMNYMDFIALFSKGSFKVTSDMTRQDGVKKFASGYKDPSLLFISKYPYKWKLYRIGFNYIKGLYTIAYEQSLMYMRHKDEKPYIDKTVRSAYIYVSRDLLNDSAIYTSYGVSKYMACKSKLGDNVEYYFGYSKELPYNAIFNIEYRVSDFVVSDTIEEHNRKILEDFNKHGKYIKTIMLQLIFTFSI